MQWISKLSKCVEFFSLINHLFSVELFLIMLQMHEMLYLSPD